jgi:serine/threonine protein kinase
MGFEQYLHVTVVPVLAAVIAVFGSRMVHGISVEVAKARELGSYRLQTKIGSGGMGEVWKAEHSMLARPAAVKLIRATEGGVSETSVKRFEREAQVTAQLHSPHTVDLYDFGIANDGTIYYVMELLDGVDLDQLVREHGAQPAERVVHILDQMCHSLQEAHAAGLVHRDVKPANTFVCRYGEDYDFVKVLDFGLVALKPQTDAPKSEALTVDNVVQGSPAFMSPEAITAPKEVGPASDLYAVGCIAYWLLTGRDVFESEGVVARMADHIHSKPEPLSASGVEVPSELESLVMDCLAKDPADRPSSAAEVAERLHASVFSEPWNQERARLWWKAHAA